MYYLINMKAKQINSKHDTLGAAEAAGALADWDFHIVKPSEFEGCTITDLVEFFNNIPGNEEKVARFSSKAVGIERIQKAIAFPEAGAKAKVKKPRKPRDPNAKAGRKPAWNTVALTAAGKSDELRFHKESPRYKVYELIKKHGPIEREKLEKMAEKEISLTAGQTNGCVNKLVARKLAELS
jgi:hypothetical protein